MSVVDRRVIVTGGASGMGAGIVTYLSDRGARVASMDMNPEAGEEVAERCGATFVKCDVANDGSVTDAFRLAIDGLDGLDVLIHAAAVSPSARAIETDLATWNHAMAVNATGTYLTNMAAYAALRVQGGQIINFASAAGARGLPGKAAYAASKGAVLAWTRTLAQEWGADRITVNALAPAIWTPMYDRTRAAMTPEQLAVHDRDTARDIVLGGKLGDLERDFLPVIGFLASDAAQFITGQIIAIDGGMLQVR